MNGIYVNQFDYYYSANVFSYLLGSNGENGANMKHNSRYLFGCHLYSLEMGPKGYDAFGSLLNIIPKLLKIVPNLYL